MNKMLHLFTGLRLLVLAGTITGILWLVYSPALVATTEQRLTCEAVIGERPKPSDFTRNSKGLSDFFANEDQYQDALKTWLEERSRWCVVDVARQAYRIGVLLLVGSLLWLGISLVERNLASS